MYDFIKWKGNKLAKAKIRRLSLHQLVSFLFDDNLHYFCSYVTLRGPVSGKNMSFRLKACRT